MADKFRVRVKSVKHHDPNSKFTVFEGTFMKKGPRSPWRDTKNKAVFTGQLMLCIPNDKFDIDATFVESKRYGEQYRIETYHRIEPGTIEEIKKFLINSTRGLGPGRALKLTDTYGLDTLNVLRKDLTLLDGLGIPEKSKIELSNALMVSDIFEELLLFFRLHGLDHRYALPIYSKYEDHALEKLKDDPYAVYLDDIIPFKVADDAAHALGMPYNSYGRTLAAVLATVRSESDDSGNVYVDKRELSVRVMRYLSKSKCLYGDFPSISSEELDIAVAELCNRQFLILDNDLLYLTENLIAENQVAQFLLDIQNSPKSTFHKVIDIWGAINSIPGIKLSREQRDAVVAAIQEPISILTGGPGTGKTQTVSVLLQVIKKLDPKADIRLCAPTGKAAARISELSGSSASTIHRMLGIGGFKTQVGIGELVCDYLVVDEFSMVDIQLCKELFKAVCTSARVIIVGDDNQLPSVGPGLVLRDLIEAGTIYTTKLTQVFRQTGTTGRIVSNAHALINQKPGQDIVFKTANKPNEDFYFINADSPSQIRDKVSACCDKLVRARKLSLSEIEVLSPVHGGELGTDRFNAILQERFNPIGYGYESDGATLQVGDKVIHTKNNYELGVFNGETGIVKSIGYTVSQAVEVEYKDKTVWYSSEEVEELELAYALTVHKSQGSEYKAVIIPIHELLVRNMNMNLIYTAITRAKGVVVLVGSKKAFSEAIRKKETKRASELVDKITGVTPIPLAA